MCVSHHRVYYIYTRYTFKGHTEAAGPARTPFPEEAPRAGPRPLPGRGAAGDVHRMPLCPTGNAAEPALSTQKALE